MSPLLSVLSLLSSKYPQCSPPFVIFGKRSTVVNVVSLGVVVFISLRRVEQQMVTVLLQVGSTVLVFTVLKLNDLCCSGTFG